MTEAQEPEIESIAEIVKEIPVFAVLAVLLVGIAVGAVAYRIYLEKMQNAGTREDH